MAYIIIPIRAQVEKLSDKMDTNTREYGEKFVGKPYCEAREKLADEREKRMERIEDKIDDLISINGGRRKGERDYRSDGAGDLG